MGTSGILSGGVNEHAPSASASPAINALRVLILATLAVFSCPWRCGFCICCCNTHQVAIGNAIGWTFDYAVVGLKSGAQLNKLAEIACDCDGFQNDLVI